MYESNGGITTKTGILKRLAPMPEKLNENHSAQTSRRRGNLFTNTKNTVYEKNLFFTYTGCCADVLR